MHKFIFDGKKIQSKHELLDAFAENLSFPEWFGHNWDALEDLLPGNFDGKAQFIFQNSTKLKQHLGLKDFEILQEIMFRMQDTFSGVIEVVFEN